MFTLENLIGITGDVGFADHLEQIAFNALPTQTTDDYLTRQYFQQANQVMLTRHVRNHPRARHIPIIMITSADDRLKAAAADAGVTLVLGKPYAEEALLACIEKDADAGAGAYRQAQAKAAYVRRIEAVAQLGLMAERMGVGFAPRNRTCGRDAVR